MMTRNVNKETFVRITNRMMYEDMKSEFKSVNNKLDEHINNYKVSRAKMKSTISWHQKTLYAGGTLLITIIGWLIFITQTGVKP